MNTLSTRLRGGLVAVAAALLSTAAFAQSGTITLYTSQPSDQMAEAIKAFNQQYPNVKVEVFRSGTTEVMNKLQAEFTAGAPQADVVLIADAVAATQLKNDGRLLAYKEAPVGKLPKALVDPDMTFFGTKLITTGIVYNRNLVKTPPKSWNDLLAKNVASSLIMPSPLYSGAAAIHVGTVVQNKAFGWGYYEKLADGGAMASKGNGNVIEAVAKGEKAYGILIEYMAFNAKTKGSPVDFVFPAEGVSVISQPVAILKTSKNLPAAKAFVDWQLSEAAQRQSVGQGYFPVFAGVAPPAGYPQVDGLKFLNADNGTLLKDDEANKKKFADIFGG
ncbi:ABC transporter substrate-binding protein [Uliginosibacterium sp. H1]|uniref:ABC transporter substrate-binding protein n=1 Tax=Uliginosibacterium sp. H1 TaxID=3114757 RepID=UPI002E1737A9|nr:ABC transporter substrate-binding protein [Uliginosibacterium sp. H1]